MFSRLFEGRNKTVTKLIKLSDYLGYSLRENIRIFSIDALENKVTFVTETNKVIEGTYCFGRASKNEPEIALKFIKVEDGDIFQDVDKFDAHIKGSISNFIEDIYESNLAEVNDSFSKVLELWQTRLKFNRSVKQLQEKTIYFNKSQEIMDTEEFNKLEEVGPGLIEFLKENKEKVLEIPEIKNAVKLSQTVSDAFDLPRLTIEDLIEEGSYVIPEEINTNIYEMICRQELIKNEILETKRDFDTIWATNDKINALAGYVFNMEDSEVVQALIEAVVEVPYLALASKKQITKTITNNLDINETVDISETDIKKFSSRLFEMKKPIKRLLLNMLNEQYGINIQNLKDIPSFKSLLNTQVVIFEALSKISAKNSVQREVLSEIATMLKGKTGVQSIDVNAVLQNIFEQSGYTDLFVSEAISTNFSLSDSDLNNIDMQDLIDLVLERFNAQDDSEGDEESVLQHEDEFSIKGDKKKKKDSDDDEDEEEEDDDKDDKDKNKKNEDSELEEAEEVEAPEKEAEEETEEETEDVEVPELSRDELMKAIGELEGLIGDDIDLDDEEKEDN